MKRKSVRQLSAVLAFVALTSFVIISCRKMDYVGRQTVTVSNYFTARGPVKPEVLRVMENLKVQNKKTGFIRDFAKNYGLAIWDKALVSSSTYSAAARGFDSENDTSYVLIPIAFENIPQVHAALACTVLKDSVLAIRLIDGRDYPSYASRTTPGVTSYELSLTLMYLDKQVFGHDFFMFTDSLAAKGKARGISTVKFSETDSTHFRLVQTQIISCVVVNIPLNSGQVVGCPAGTPNCPQYTTGLDCTIYTMWFDDGTGNGGTGGGSPGGGESGGGSGGGGVGPKPCQPAGGRLIVDGRVAPLCEDAVPPISPTGPGWAPLTDHEIQLGYHHFDNWEVSAEDLQSIRYWRNRNIDTTGLDSCLKIVLQKVLNSAGDINNPLGQMLSKMDRAIFERNNLTKFKVKIVSAFLPSTTRLGQTGDDHYDPVTKIYSATITLNLHYINKATELSWFNTIIHELLHAYLASIHYRYFHSLSTADIQDMNVDELFDSYLDSLIVRNTRQEIIDFLTGNPEVEHNYMADFLVNAMAQTLEVIEGSTIQNKRNYWFLAWSGLHNTRTWKQHWRNYPDWPPVNASPSDDSTRGLKYALTEARIDSIRDVITNENNGLPGAFGKYKIPGGCY